MGKVDIYTVQEKSKIEADHYKLNNTLDNIGTGINITNQGIEVLSKVVDLVEHISDKSFYTFEYSAHSPNVEEPERFV